MKCRCFDIFSPAEQKILKKYRMENFAKKTLIYKERRAIGKCPLTPEEVIFCSNLHAFVCLFAINSASYHI
jgi:hypothetical protein